MPHSVHDFGLNKKLLGIEKFQLTHQLPWNLTDFVPFTKYELGDFIV